MHNFSNIIDKILEDSTDIQTFSSQSDDYYWEQLDPTTEQRFRIPMLSTDNFEYYDTYIKYMKLREANPEQFERLMAWS
jgi:hypothetical protein